MTTTLESIWARLEVINSEITGISRAYSAQPAQVATADLPCIWTRWLGADGPMATGPAGATLWDFDLVLVEKPLAQGLDPDDHVEALLPWPETIRNEYASRMHLNTSAGVALLSGAVSVALIGNVRNLPVMIGDTWYPAIHMALRIKDLTSVTVSG